MVVCMILLSKLPICVVLIALYEINYSMIERVIL